MLKNSAPLFRRAFPRILSISVSSESMARNWIWSYRGSTSLGLSGSSCWYTLLFSSANAATPVPPIPMARAAAPPYCLDFWLLLMMPPPQLSSNESYNIRCTSEHTDYTLFVVLRQASAPPDRKLLVPTVSYEKLLSELSEYLPFFSIPSPGIVTAEHPIESATPM